MMNFRFSIFDCRLKAQNPRARSGSDPKSQIANRKSQIPPQLQIANCKLQIRTAFSFTEVLFAVIILGIGFIMIAAIFPVAIQQTKTTTEETAGGTIARGAVNYIQAVVTDDDPMNPGNSNIPDTATGPGDAGMVRAIGPDDMFGNRLWMTLRGNVILPEDPRYGWVALYRRGQDVAGNPLPYAQIIVIPTEVRNAPIYVTDDTVSTPGPAVNLQPRVITGVTVEDHYPNPDTINVGASFNVDAAAPGTHVVMATGTGSGRIYRIGNSLGGSLYELIPGSDMQENDGSSFTGSAYIVGRGWRNPSDSTFTGNAMDIGIYTTFVKVN
jgi:hypothetical protein